MEINITTSVFLQLLAAILGIVTGILMWIFPRDKYTPNKWYGYSMMALAFYLGIGFLIESHLILMVPHVYRAGNLFELIAMPLSYLYLRSMVCQKPLRQQDLLHVLPALLFLIDFTPFFLLSAEEKRFFIQQDLISMTQVLQFEQGWIFPDGFYPPLRNVIYLIYWVLQVGLFVSIYRLRNDKLIRHWVIWIRTLLSLQILYFLPFFVYLFLGTFNAFWVVSQVTSAISLLFTSFYLLLCPNILYGIKGVITLQAQAEKPKEIQPEDSYRNMLYIDPFEVKRVTQTIKILMEEQDLYLQHGFTLHDLANVTNIPYHQLSTIINRTTQMNFKDYLNQYRIQYCIKGMESGEWKNITLEGIAHECGFNNRNSFTMSFKKVTGITPSEYIKQLK